MHNKAILQQVAQLLGSLSNNKPVPTHRPFQTVRHDPQAWQRAKNSVVQIFEPSLASQRIPLAYAGVGQTKTGATAHRFVLAGFDQIEVLVAPDFNAPHAPRIIYSRGLSPATSCFYINNQPKR